MEQLIANLVGKTRRATLNGRDYIVAPLSLIVTGVLNGSKGALFYPSDEIGKDPQRWNHTPIVVYHPVINGVNVSARDPDVLNNSGIGIVLKSHVKNGKLRAEGWFDIDATRRIDPRVLANLEAGRPIELSTGLFTTNETAPLGSNYRGASYDYIARDYVPDHLAILPDQIGACSINDGCGVLVNGGPGSGPQPGGGSKKKEMHSALAKRFSIPEEAVADILGNDVKELRRRDDYYSPSNTLEPTTDFEKFPLNSAKIGSYGDPENSYVEVLGKFKPKDVLTAEAEDGIKTRNPSYPLYVEWAKKGSEPPPINISINGDGTIVSSNRRRVLAAQDAGVESIKGWYSPFNKETGLPLKYGDVLRASKEVTANGGIGSGKAAVESSAKLGSEYLLEGSLIADTHLDKPRVSQGSILKAFQENGFVAKGHDPDGVVILASPTVITTKLQGKGWEHSHYQIKDGIRTDALSKGSNKITLTQEGAGRTVALATRQHIVANGGPGSGPNPGGGSKKKEKLSKSQYISAEIEKEFTPEEKNVFLKEASSGLIPKGNSEEISARWLQAATQGEVNHLQSEVEHHTNVIATEKGKAEIKPNSKKVIVNPNSQDIDDKHMAIDEINLRQRANKIKKATIALGEAESLLQKKQDQLATAKRNVEGYRKPAKFDKSDEEDLKNWLLGNNSKQGDVPLNNEGQGEPMKKLTDDERFDLILSLIHI